MQVRLWDDVKAVICFCCRFLKGGGVVLIRRINDVGSWEGAGVRGAGRTASARGLAAWPFRLHGRPITMINLMYGAKEAKPTCDVCQNGAWATLGGLRALCRSLFNVHGVRG